MRELVGSHHVECGEISVACMGSGNLVGLRRRALTVSQPPKPVPRERARERASSAARATTQADARPLAHKARISLALSDHKVLSVSDSMQELLGFSPDDFLQGRVSFAQLIHPDDQDIAEMLYALEGGEPSGTFNIRLRSAQGRILCIKGHYSKESQAAGVLLVLLLQDARNLERTLPDAAMMVNFKSMMDNTDDYVYFKDRNHVFTGASQTLVAICDPAEHWTDLLGQTDYDVFPEKYADIYYRLEKQIFAGLPVAHEEQETLAKDGTKGWVDNRKYPVKNAAGEIIGLYGMARDITERKLAQEALQKSESALKEAQAIAMLGSYVLDIASGSWESSAVLDQLFGIDGSYDRSVSGWLALVHPEERAALEGYLQTDVITLGHAFDKVHRIIRPNDRAERWVHGMGRLVCDEQGRPMELRGTVQDVTDSKRSEEALQLLANVFTYAHEGIFITNQHRAIIKVNDAFTRVTGYASKDVLGKNPSLLSAPAQQGEDFSASMWAELIDTGHWSGELRNRRKSGEEYTAQLTLSAMRDAHGVATQYVGLLSDISERKRLEEKVKLLAFYDELTQLPNRRLISDRLEQTIVASKRSSVCAAMMFLDLDNFKTLNDAHGHGAGDLLLMEVARRLTECVREADTVGRIGGDEFVVMLGVLHKDWTASIEQANRVAEKIRNRLAQPYQLQLVQADRATTVEHQCTASIGVALFSGHETSQVDVMRRADAAMYQAKALGKNTIQFHTPA